MKKSARLRAWRSSPDGSLGFVAVLVDSEGLGAFEAASGNCGVVTEAAVVWAGGVGSGVGLGVLITGGVTTGACGGVTTGGAPPLLASSTSWPVSYTHLRAHET